MLLNLDHSLNGTTIECHFFNSVHVLYMEFMSTTNDVPLDEFAIGHEKTHVV